MTGVPTQPGPSPAACPPAGEVILVPADRRPEAVRRLVPPDGDDRAHARRFMRLARDHGIDLRAMWGRLGADGRISSTALAVPSPGRTAMFFVTPPTDRASVPPRAALVEHACRALADPTGDLPDVALAQALIAPADAFEQSVYETAGFRVLAPLAYLDRPLAAPPEAPDWPEGAMPTTYRPADRAVLMDILEASYEDTLDCPGLRGLRRIEDVLAGHFAAGEHDPELWTLVHLDGRPAGVLLLTPVPATRTVELVYLGLAPFARGRGIGRALLRDGLARLGEHREGRITLAVDERNVPALRLYEQEGFHPVLRRTALIRPLRQDA